MRNKSIILTSGLTIAGMAAGFGIAANAVEPTISESTQATATTQQVQATPRPTVTQTIHPTITATPSAGAEAPNDATSGSTTVEVPQSQNQQQAAPVQEAPAAQAPVQQAPVAPAPAPVVQPPATNTGAS